MQIEHTKNLINQNSFALNVKATNYLSINKVSELNGIDKQLLTNVYILGEGTNSLFVDSTIDTVMHINLKGVAITEDDNWYYVAVAAGENWHNLVSQTINNGYFGLENLALIPGSVGAAPVQNIGAYGSELADYCCTVDWYDFEQRKIISLTREQCEFAYRESVFKNNLKNKGVIVAVTLKLAKKWIPNIHYNGLNHFSDSVSAEAIFEQVVKIRQLKIPDYKKVPNAGSFFKNPVIEIRLFKMIQKQHSNIPFYKVNDTYVKIPAAWLIEQVGMKQIQEKNVSVHQQQALVIVNKGTDNGNDIISFAKLIVNKVKSAFAITLEPEVRIVGQKGEINYKDIFCV